LVTFLPGLVTFSRLGGKNHARELGKFTTVDYLDYQGNKNGLTDLSQLPYKIAAVWEWPALTHPTAPW